ncbi:hypothetical protein CRM22_007513 [Opisthorchis felineus]|uniref:Spc7 kinetochore protein domain-containing protein n=2 Tax=Opisthorchis felineus TaxID=147828 RepID=A0A4S2LFI2_OPIFE|nr:hypothetical protein CRM22_007513 [Opisthorchis felineus]
MRKTPSARPTQDSVINDSTMGRPSTRRVSFARVISIWGADHESSQLPLSSVSDELTEVPKPTGLVSNMISSAVPEMSDMSGLIDPEQHPPVISQLVDMEITPTSSNQSLDMSVCPTDDPSVQLEPILSDSAMDIISPTVAYVRAKSPSVLSALSPTNVAFETNQLAERLAPTVRTPPAESSKEDSVTPVPSAKSTITPGTTQAPLSTRPLIYSLPPLRRHPDMSTLEVSRLHSSMNPHSKTDNRILRARNTDLGGQQGKLGDNLMIHSLAVTPLRQVCPNDRIQGGASLLKDNSRLDPARLIPATSRLHNYLMDMSSYPLCEDPSGDVQLSEILWTRQPVSMDKENLPVPTFPDNLEKLKYYKPELYTEFLHARRAVEFRCLQRLSDYVRMCESRNFTVMNENWASKPVVEQMNKMDELQLSKFVAEARERFFQLESVAKQEYLDQLEEDNVDYRNEQKWEMDCLAKMQEEIDRERQRLEEQLKELDSEIKSWISLRDQWNKTSKGLEALDQEIQNLMLQMEKMTEEHAQMSREMFERLSTSCAPRRRCRGPVTFAVGAKDLFGPLDDKHISDPPDDDPGEVAREITKLYLPCSIECVSFDDQAYSVRCLFGLVSFFFRCTAVQSTTTTTSRSSGVTVLPPTSLTVLTVECCAPPKDCTPVDCEAVESFAQFTIQFFNSLAGQAQLNSRLVGVSFDNAIQQLEFILTPYVLFAADLRACYLSGTRVQFEAAAPAELTSSAVYTQKSLMRSTPGRSLLSSEMNQSTRPLLSDSCHLDRILPTGPVSVLVTIFCRETRTVLSLRFTFLSIDVHQPSSPTRSVTVLLGNADVEKIQRLLDLTEVKPSCMHRVVTAVQRLIVSG